MNDALGARVIVYFLSQLPQVDRELRNHDSLELSSEDPPKAYLDGDTATRLGLSDLAIREKDSGYASVHYIARLRRTSVPEARRPWFEIQVRTLVEDTWGEIEHILGYKPNKRTSFAVKHQFRIISAHLGAIDRHFNFLHEELLRFQTEANYKQTDPLNAENFPGVLNEIGLSCAQAEIDGLLKLLNSRKVRVVGELVSIGTSRRLETIRNTYRSQIGRAPNDFETIANLANLKGSPEPEEVDRIRAQIQYLAAWEELKSQSEASQRSMRRAVRGSRNREPAKPRRPPRRRP